MPPNLVRKVRRLDDVPQYDAHGRRVGVASNVRVLEVEPSPLIEAILDYLNTSPV